MRVNRNSSLFVIFAMLLPMALAAAETRTLDFEVNRGKFYVNGSEFNVPGASWDGSTKTLTLNNVTWETSANYALYIKNSALTLNLVGNNSFISTYNGSGDGAGVYAAEGLVITGSGSLNAESGITSGRSAGIWNYRNELNILSGLITAHSNTSMSTRTSTGIFGGYGSIKINGGNITVTAGPGKDESCGISADAGITLNGGTLNLKSTEDPANPGTGTKAGFFTWGGTINLNGGVFIAAGETQAIFLANNGKMAFNSTDDYNWWHSTNADGSNPVKAAGPFANDKSYKWLRLDVPTFGTVPPNLTNLSINRTSNTEATITFITDKVGIAYYLVLDKGMPAPEKPDHSGTGWQQLGAVTEGVNTFSIALVAGDKDVYVMEADKDYRVSNMLYVEAPAIFVPNIPYLDEKGVQKIASNVIALAATDKVKTLGVAGHDRWVLFSEAQNLTEALAINGNVYLILKDGSNWAINNGGIRVSSGSSLTIYAQSVGSTMGKLFATGSNGSAGIGGGNITINGGNITATGAVGGSGINGSAIAINSGIVNAKRGSAIVYDISASLTAITGGSVFAANKSVIGFNPSEMRYPVKVTVSENDVKINDVKVTSNEYIAITGGNYANDAFAALDPGVAWLWLPEDLQPLDWEDESITYQVSDSEPNEIDLAPPDGYTNKLMFDLKEAFYGAKSAYLASNDDIRTGNDIFYFGGPKIGVNNDSFYVPSYCGVDVLSQKLFNMYEYFISGPATNVKLIFTKDILEAWVMPWNGATYDLPVPVIVGVSNATVNRSFNHRDMLIVRDFSGELLAIRIVQVAHILEPEIEVPKGGVDLFVDQKIDFTGVAGVNRDIDSVLHLDFTVDEPGYCGIIDINGDTRMFHNGESRNITLEAKVYKIKIEFLPTFVVSFNSNGGTEIATISNIDPGEEIAKPMPDPAKTGHSFDEWYDDENYGNLTSFPVTVNNDITLYAKWAANSYNITYNLDGGSGASHDSYTYGVGFILPEPIKINHTFAGWHDNDELVTAILNTDMGDKEFFAKWKLNTYTVTFNTDGGSAISSIRDVPHGSTIEAPVEPGKMGYSFAGWYKSDLVTAWDFTADVVTGATTLYAKWTVKSYNITYNLNGGSGSSQDSYTYGIGLVLPEPTRANYTFAGWYDNFSLRGDSVAAISNAEIGDREFWAKWTAESHIVMYELNGGTQESGFWTSYTYGVGLVLPTVPTREHHTFAGWYDNSNLTGNSVTKISNTEAEDKKFWAKWIIHTYTVTFNTDGNLADTTGVEHGTKIIEPAQPSKTGYTFTGWYKEPALTNEWDFETDVVTVATTLYVKWAVNIYQVTYHLNGGSGDSLGSYTYGIGLVLPTPTKDYHTFAGWYDNDVLVTKISTTETGDKEFFAKWIIHTYTVTFNTDGNLADTTGVEHGTKITEPEMPVKTGHSFVGWFKSDLTTAWDFANDLVTSATTLYAKWMPNTYKITYNLNGGSGDSLGSYTYGVGLVLPTPTKDYHTFAGWYDNDVLVTKISTTETGDKEFFAKWIIHTYTVTFNTDGNLADTTGVEHGTKITEPEMPVKTGHSFVGWFKSDLTTAWDFANDLVTSATTLYAKWMPNTYKITYNLNGGSGDSLGSYTYGVGLVLPDNPTKTNYAFAGWYYGDELVTAISATEIGDKEFFAKWKLNTYTVIFNTNGGTQINPLTNVEHGIAIQEPPEPAKDGYIFIGWYLGENPVSFPITITADITLYVKWVDEPDNLEYAINITSPGFEKNEALSNDSTVYFTASATLCEVEETDIEITLNDKYVGLEMGGALLANGVPDGEGGIKYSKHVILRHKGGLDTLKYKLHKNNGLMEHNSIIIATPFPFDSIVKQKWNNVFVVNNNPATNGGYRFTQFKWFKNGKETSNTLQYFSAGPRSTDLLNPSDDFTVQVSTEDGVKINSCIGHPKISEENPAFQKQVLGIGKNNPPPDSEVYTTKGERSTGKTPGVYIIRRSSK